jgi:hypothetical protein
MRHAFAIVLVAWGGWALAGQGWAGEGRGAAPSGAVSAPQGLGHAAATSQSAPANRQQAWVATYALRDTRGERALVVVRTDDRIEYRAQGEPVHVWRRLADGLEYRELHPRDGRVVVYAPGDLRALGHDPDWNQLHDLVAPAERARLRERGKARFEGHAARLLRGDLDGARITLDWLDDARLPARYVRRNGRGDDTTLILRKLDRVDASKAFTTTQDLREIDYTDLGDMELDEFASKHIHQGFQAN